MEGLYNQLLTLILVELENNFNVYVKMNGKILLIDYDSLKFKSFGLAFYKPSIGSSIFLCICALSHSQLLSGALRVPEWLLIYLLIIGRPITSCLKKIGDF